VKKWRGCRCAFVCISVPFLPCSSCCLFDQLPLWCRRWGQYIYLKR
jgi:hypothetical protein